MFTSDDFLEILKFFKDLKDLQDQGLDTLPPTNLDPVFLTTILSDQSQAKKLFESTIDQPSFSSDDYKRLKNFLVDWYSSLRSIVTTQKTASGIYSLPETHLNELIKSFGFEVKSLLRMSRQNKINLFFDLINLYKIKGTPESIGKILQYYDLPNLEILEYWLQYDENNELVFKPSIVYSSNLTNISPTGNIDFDSVKILDPHWFLTKNQINSKFLTEKIGIPSKSPYLGIRPILLQSGKEQILITSILSRKIHDEYDEWNSSGNLTSDLNLTFFNLNVSLLEAYLSYIYIFNMYYDRTLGGSGISYLCYDGSSITNISDIIDLADSIITRPSSKLDKKIKYSQFQDFFTRLVSTNFLSDYDTAGIKLNLINSSLKDLIDYQYSIGEQEELLVSILVDISYWISDNIGSTYPNLANLTYGFSTINYIQDKINFFKPYRARLIYVDSVYVIENPLEDSLISEDDTLTSINEIVVDWDTADSEPGYLEGFHPIGDPVRSTPPTLSDKQILDIYVDSGGVVKAVYTDSTADVSVFVMSTPAIGQYRITNIFLELYGMGGAALHVQYNSIPETIGGISTKVLSDPDAGYYIIRDIYYNHINEFMIVYDTNPVVWPVDSTSRIYYSRNLYDCGSFFDIGAATDFPPDECELHITDTYYDIYNYHTENTTSASSIEYTLDATSGEVIAVITDGGWYNFDEGLHFDNPVINDICNITVTDL